MNIRLIVAADEPALFFSTIEAAEQWMEPIDVPDGLYTAAYGPVGEPYLIEADGSRVTITRALDEPNPPDELRGLLLRYFAAAGELAGADQSLPSTLARCRPSCAGM